MQKPKKTIMPAIAELIRKHKGEWLAIEVTEESDLLSIQPILTLPLLGWPYQEQWVAVADKAVVSHGADPDRGRRRSSQQQSHTNGLPIARPSIIL